MAATERTVPELASGYQRARTQVVVSAALLFLWRAGIEFDASIPVLGVKVTAGEKLPLLLSAVLAYAVVRLVIEWFQSDVARRRRTVSRIDLALTLGVATGAAWSTASAFTLPLPPLPRVSVFVPAATLVVLGLAIGASTGTLLELTQFIRSKEEAARVALPRYPVALRAMFRVWCVVMVISAFALLLSPAFAPPLSQLWPWLMGVPASVLLLSQAVSMALPWRTLRDGTKVTRREYIRRLRPAFDSHDTAYQHGGWDRPVPAAHSPLYVLAQVGYTEEVRKLLDQGLQPNQQDMHGWTPLNIAVAQGHDETANVLLQRGADPNLANFRGRTPLMFAARYGKTGLVRDLIAFGANVNLNPSPDAGPLAMAAAMGHAEVVNLLLGAGSDVSLRDRDGKTALDYAQAEGHGEIAAVLRRKMQGGSSESVELP